MPDDVLMAAAGEMPDFGEGVEASVADFMPSGNETTQEAPQTDQVSELREEVAKWKKMFGDSQNTVGDLRRDLDEVKGKISEPKPEAFDIDKFTEQLYPGADPSEPFYKQNVNAMLKLQEIAHQMQASQLRPLQEKIAALEAHMSETAAFSNSGLDRQFVDSYLSEHPGLRNLDPQTRMAVLKDIAKGEAPARTAPTAGNPGQRASQFVEGSNQAMIRDSSLDSVRSKFGKMKSSEMGDWLSNYIEKNGSGGLW